MMAQQCGRSEVRGGGGAAASDIQPGLQQEAGPLWLGMSSPQTSLFMGSHFIPFFFLLLLSTYVLSGAITDT